MISLRFSTEGSICIPWDDVPGILHLAIPGVKPREPQTNFNVEEELDLYRVA